MARVVAVAVPMPMLAVVPMVLTIWPGLFAGLYLLARSRKITDDSSNHEDMSDETIER